MKYKPLKPIYHKNRAQYEETFHSRFYSESAVRLPVDIGKNPAFFIVNAELLQIIFDIMELNGKILLISEKLPDIARYHFHKTCMINEISMTNEMEGVHSSRKEIKKIIEGVKGTPNEKCLVGLVQKYTLLMDNPYNNIRNCNDILNIFNDLVREEIATENPKELPDGEIFRKDSVSIYNESQKEIHTGLYPEERIISAMQSSIGILNDESINILIRIALFHYMFGYIHPFYNGNGRVSRFISSSLIAESLNPYISYRLSHTIKNEKKKYYDAFEICNHPLNRGDLTPFIIAFLKIVKKAAIEIKEIMEQKKGDYDHYRNITASLGLKDSDRVFLNTLISTTLFSLNDIGLSGKELCSILEISRSTLSKRIAEINKNNTIIIKNTADRKNHYSVDFNVLEHFKELSQ